MPSGLSWAISFCMFFFFFQAEDGIRDDLVTGVQTCALPIFPRLSAAMAFRIAEDAERSGRVLAVRMPVDDEYADEPWKMSPSRHNTPRSIEIGRASCRERV